MKKEDTNPDAMGDAAGRDEWRPNGAETSYQSRDFIGKGLKSMYQHVAEEPVPDKILKLLEKLDEHP